MQNIKLAGLSATEYQRSMWFSTLVNPILPINILPTLNNGGSMELEKFYSIYNVFCIKDGNATVTPVTPANDSCLACP